MQIHYYMLEVCSDSYCTCIFLKILLCLIHVVLSLLWSVLWVLSESHSIQQSSVLPIHYNGVSKMAIIILLWPKWMKFIGTGKPLQCFKPPKLTAFWFFKKQRRSLGKEKSNERSVWFFCQNWMQSAGMVTSSEKMKPTKFQR